MRPTHTLYIAKVIFDLFGIIFLCYKSIHHLCFDNNKYHVQEVSHSRIRLPSVWVYIYKNTFRAYRCVISCVLSRFQLKSTFKILYCSLLKFSVYGDFFSKNIEISRYKAFFRIFKFQGIWLTRRL